MKLKIALLSLVIIFAALNPVFAKTDDEIFTEGFDMLCNDPSRSVADANISVYDSAGTQIKCKIYFNMYDWYRVAGEIKSEGKTAKFNSLTSVRSKWDYFGTDPAVKYPGFDLNGRRNDLYIYEMSAYPYAWIMEKIQPDKFPSREEFFARANIRRTNYNGAECVYGEFDSRYGKAGVWINCADSTPVQIQFPMYYKDNTITVQYGDYRPVSSRLVAFKCAGYIGQKLCWQSQLNSFQLGVDMPMDIFNPKLFYTKSVEQCFKEYELTKKLKAEHEARVGASAQPGLFSPSAFPAITATTVPSVTPSGRVPAEQQGRKKEGNKENGYLKIIIVIIFLAGAAALVYFYARSSAAKK